MEQNDFMKHNKLITISPCGNMVVPCCVCKKTDTLMSMYRYHKGATANYYCSKCHKDEIKKGNIKPAIVDDLYPNFKRTWK